MNYLSKFPGMFSVCAAMDGAYLNWAYLSQNHSGIANAIFDNDEDYFNNFCPYYNIPLNSDQLVLDTYIFMAKAALYDQAIRNLLEAEDISYQHIDTGLGHNLGDILNQQGRNIFEFINTNLSFDIDTTTSVRNPQSVKDLMFYPNPFSDYTVRFDNPYREEYRLILLDTTGVRSY